MENEKQSRHKIAFRDDFSYEYKQSIMQKSGEKCCLCGRKCYIGYGATIDHFIPLVKGGTNEDANLVQMCEDCNKKKGSDLYSPSYVKEYLNPESYKELIKYTENYLRKFEYIKSTNLFAFDRIKAKMAPLYSENVRSISKLRKLGIGTSVEVVKASEDDLDELVKYYVEYLKKRDLLDSEDVARDNVEFFLKFYSVYYIKKCGEITMMMVGSIQELDGVQCDESGETKLPIEKALLLTLFSKYITDASISTINYLIKYITYDIFDYYGLSVVPISILTPKTDEKLFMYMGYPSYPSNMPVPFVKTNLQATTDEAPDYGAYNEFCRRIKYSENNMKSFLEERGVYETESWLIDLAFADYNRPSERAINAAADAMRKSM